MSANDKINSDHVEQLECPQNEAYLAGAIALASLFSSCVEAFGLIHPSQQWNKAEQLLLTRLGLQQARLLIWGSVVGIASPPAQVTTKAVPKNPSMAYPDLAEPTFFDARDPRLDEPDLRTTIEQTLSAIVDRSSSSTREEMMAKFGLKPPKKIGPILEQAMDTTRLESFREKHELLKEVAEDVAQLNTRRNQSLVYTSWMIADIHKFGNFIDLTQEKVDYLINLLDVKDKVDRAMRMDIRIFGWHVIPDRARTALDISKLRMLQEICSKDYPEYLVAIQQALDNINRETRELAMSSSSAITSKEHAKLFVAASEKATSGTNDHHAKVKKRPALFKLFRSFNHKKGSQHEATRHSHSHSVSGPTTRPDDTSLEPVRSHSDAGPDIARLRSTSIDATIQPPFIDEDLRNRLAKMDTHTSEGTNDDAILPHVVVETFGKGLVVDTPLASPALVLRPAKEPGTIDRHDMYKGIARVETKDLHQADY